MNLTQTFGRSWGKVLVNEVEGPCVRTQSAREPVPSTWRCENAAAVVCLVERLGNDSDLIFPILGGQQRTWVGIGCSARWLVGQPAGVFFSPTTRFWY